MITWYNKIELRFISIDWRGTFSTNRNSIWIDRMHKCIAVHRASSDCHTIGVEHAFLNWFGMIWTLLALLSDRHSPVRVIELLWASRDSIIDVGSTEKMAWNNAYDIRFIYRISTCQSIYKYFFYFSIYVCFATRSSVRMLFLNVRDSFVWICMREILLLYL